jgi:uncharacterized membrane protein YbaN (DUF454 family)
LPPTGPPETEQGPATIASEAERAPISRRRAYAYRAVGIIAVALAAVGAVLPLMPTTVFLLIALWAFARGSPAWADRLRAHRRFGPYIRDWEERGAIPRKAKATAVVMMAVSWAGLAVAGQGPLVLGVVGGALVAVASFILTRPSH